MWLVRNTHTGAYFGDTDPLSKSAFKTARGEDFNSYRPRFEHVTDKSGRLQRIVGPSDRAVAMSHDAARVMIHLNHHLEMVPK